MSVLPQAVTARWEAVPERQRATIVTAIVWAAILLYPLLDRALNLRWLNTVTDAAVFVVLALGLNIVVGFAGLLDLGYAAFFAIGAYTMGLFNSPFHGIQWGVLGGHRAGGGDRRYLRHDPRRADPALARRLSGDCHARLR